MTKTSDFESKIRKYHSLPEAIVVDYKTVGYPFFVMRLDLTYLVNRRLELQEEFVLKCLLNSLAHRGEIADFLGVEERFVEKVLSGLISQDLVTVADDFSLTITEKGSHTLQQQEILDTVSESQTFYIDALNGKLYNSFNIKKVDKDTERLKRVIKKPKKDRVEDVVDYYEEIERDLRISTGKDRARLVQVNNIENVYTDWHEVTFAFYKNSPDEFEVGYETFSRDSIQVDYRKSIEKLYAEGKKVLETILSSEQETEEEKAEFQDSNDWDFGIRQEDIKAVERLKVKIRALNESDSFVDGNNRSINEQRKTLNQQLKEITTQSNIVEIIHTSEHRTYLLKALQEARQRLMIVSPWIRNNVVDNNFISALEDCCKRKIDVYIFYGIKSQGRSSLQNDKSAVGKLNKLANSHQNFNFEKVVNTHRKIIVCDDKFGIVTSFNFLSFKADPTMTYRDELGVVIKDKKAIENLFNSGLSLADKDRD